MKAPERTTYIWRKEGERRQLEMVCHSLHSAAKYIAEKTESKCERHNVCTLIDTEIPIANTFIITSYLKWKSDHPTTRKKMIEASPVHLRFAGFNYKFEECEELQG